jgi:mannose-6-phosphate isomerase-like protein (cupin superfamily)
MQFVFSTSQTKRYRFPTHVNDLVVDRADSQTSEVFVVVLEPGEAPPLHQHDDTEQVFYIMEGEGTLRIGGEKKEFAVRPADVVRVPPAILHSIQCTGQKLLRYLAIDCFVAGRPKAEPTWDSHVRVVCRREGWDYQQVISGDGEKSA